MSVRVAVAIACAIPRLIYLAIAGPGQADTYYISLAGSLLRSGTLAEHGAATSAFEPGYPVFLAAARWAARDNLYVLAALQIVVCCIGAVLLFELSSAVTRSRRAALASAGLFAAYPYLIRQSVAWMEISVLATLLLGTLLAFDRIGRSRRHRPAIVCGLLFGATLLTRAMTAPVWGAAVLLLLWRRRAGAAAILAAVTCLAVAPFALRNRGLDGSLLPTRLGENLFVGNNEYADRMIPRYDLDLLPGYGEQVARERLGVPPGASVDPATLDRALTGAALEFMRDHPWRTLRRKALNIIYFFDVRLVPREPNGGETTIALLPNGEVRVDAARQRSRLASLAHSAVYGVVLVGGLLGAWLRRRAMGASDVLMLATVAVFALTSAIFFPTTRMRSPVDPILMLYAGAAAAAMTARLERGRPRPSTAGAA